jgi:hypothetical protein
VVIWIQVRDVCAEHARLAAAGVTVIREPVTEPWGLTEMWITDPDGIRTVLRSAGAIQVRRGFGTVEYEIALVREEYSVDWWFSCVEDGSVFSWR